MKWTPIYLAFLVALLGVARISPALTFNSNLILNGDAEAGAGSASGDDSETIPDWNPTGGFTVVQYGAPSFPTLTDPGPADRGANFFAGGTDNAASSATQTIDVSSIASDIDAENVHIDLSGYLGGFSDQRDHADLTATYLGATDNVLGTITLAGPSPSDRKDNTGLLFESTTDELPISTRSIELTLSATRLDGNYNDGYADNLSLTLFTNQSPPPPPPGVPAPLAVWLGVALLGFLVGWQTIRRFMRA